MDPYVEAFVSRQEKSTNVRSRKTPLAKAALRAGFQWIGPAAPGLAAVVAERLFLSAPRHPRPARELEVLDRAVRFAVPTDDGHIPVWSWGDGPRTALLVHGWEGRGSQLGSFVQPLVDAGFRVVAFDAPGHGDAESDRASLFDHADAVARVARVVGPVSAFLAHSMGSMATALAFAGQPEKATRLVFVAPPIDPRRFAAHFASELAIGPAVSSRLRARVERRYGRSMDDLYGPRIASKLSAPLLIIHDEDDLEVPIESGEALRDAWQGSTLLRTRGLGHRRVLRDPQVISAAVSFASDAPPRIAL